VTATEIHTTLESIFDQQIVELSRVQSPCSSSYTIEELHLIFGNGEQRTLIFKNLSADAMLESAREAKPRFLYAPEREIEVYRSILSTLGLGTPRLYGAVVQPELHRYWLFLERIDAPELWQVDGFDAWLNGAKWLAKLHTSCDPQRARNLVPHLLAYDANYYRRWVERAHQAAGPELDRIAGRYDRVIEVLLNLPSAFIHGEFYASNILIQENGSGVRVCPVDWEMAATGPGLLDVAALAAGKWSKEERSRILDAYCSALPSPLNASDFAIGFQCCQLHVALQWLGWSRGWSPPHGHAQDWLGEAIRIARDPSLAMLFE
jgi:hypothetical protein